MSSTKSLSLFIPHVFPNFTKEYIVKAFEKVGNVNIVDMITKTDRDGKEYNAVYVHFNSWSENEHTKRITKDIDNYGSSRFYYGDNMWYWILLPNTSTRPGERKPKIDLGDLNLEKPVLKRETAFSLEPGADFEECLDKFLEAEDEEDKQLEEIEAAMEEDDRHLVSIDGRYVAVLEEENMSLRQELAQVQREIFNLGQTISNLAATRACSNVTF